MKKHKKGNAAIAVSIIIAGAIIAGAVFLSRGEKTGSAAQNTRHGETQEIRNFRMPDENDFLRGNPDAKVTIVEFSDFECPFCARLHPTLSRLVEERDDVNWVYRHFPLSSIHSRALAAAIASECVAKQGGNEAFWKFSDALFLNQNNLGNDLSEEQALKFGLDLDEFRSCLSDKEIAKNVTGDGNEAVSSGGRGTPFSVAITASGRLLPFSGALPYETIVSLVDQAVNN